MYRKRLYIYIYQYPLAFFVFHTGPSLLQLFQHLTNSWSVSRAIFQALLDQRNERVVPTNLCLHVIHVFATSLQLSARCQHTTVVVSVCGRKNLAREILADCKNSEDPK